MSQLAEVMRDLVGRRVGRFAIKARIGHGGTGEVFLADDTLLKRPVAMKAIKTEHSQDSGFLERLIKEAERASQLNDEHIARIYDIVELDGRMFLVMEYVEGQTLRTRLGQPLSTEEFFSIAEQCLAGLAGAHQHGILHCDLKPENLMITPAGKVKILDFGFARRSQTSNDETMDSLDALAIGGTPAYMAPEVLLGQAPDERADVFSVGIVLYEALTGRHPFRITDTQATAIRILREEPHPMARPVLAGLDLVILRMMAKDPSQRYLSCTDALADMRAVHAGRRPVLAKASPARSYRTLKRVGSLVAVAVIAVLLTPKAMEEASQRNVSPAAWPSTRLLVVLPFQGSDDANSRAFASGLRETLTAKLVQIAERYPVEVVAASEVRGQKAQVNDAEQARAVLGATLALEGSMQQSGATVRVTYNLVDTKLRRTLRAGVITADASNPFAVQDQVIEKVLGDLEIELTKADRQRMESHGTSQPQAYEAYLRGRGYLQGYDRVEDQNNAIAAFQSSLALDPRFALAYAGLGQAYIYKYASTHWPESLAEARTACARAAELNSGIPDGEICMGMLFNKTGEYEQAVQHLERAVKLDGQRDESLRELGLAYEKLQRLMDAEMLLKRAIQVHPQYWGGYKSLGTFYAAHGHYDQAIEEFKRVVTLAPDSYGGYSNLGGVYLCQGNYAAGIAELEKSIAIHPTARALSNLGAAYFYQRNYQGAARSYQAAAQMLPSEYEIFGNLAEAYGQIDGKEDESRRNYAEALRLTEQRLSMNPRDGATLLAAALYAAMLGQDTKAEQYRNAGLKLSAQDPEARLRSAQVLAQLHKDGQALAELDQALKAGLSATEIANNPAWQRFAENQKFVTMLARAQRK